MPPEQLQAEGGDGQSSELANLDEAVGDPVGEMCPNPSPATQKVLRERGLQLLVPLRWMTQRSAPKATRLPDVRGTSTHGSRRISAVTVL
jgi:hypothetical protein